ncbi:S-adenosylmethionine:tRNA ribosyltransferase-isomerase [Sediminibacterium roseum]|uniref:S-adenosylmethionine:tRNA ribosyltransferase-isomerase n=1 Tax=Sediminibacterium roseum TaxID=1978412 RepID=A0ABW9ZTQ4_9BACT|nr:S-adenosylmethionine:tRNA ribosyltransferase-isomerase [Sediminibacterium roseum]NCI49137.1 S-adenosylmethionine:tRNA ribosyltransferase-isomerase [Sediminibacterium roseum]
MHPKNLPIRNFTYDLPDDRIAKYPLEKRDESKLLIYQNKAITQDVYANIASHLPPYAFLVFNNTKVVEARLHFERSNGSRIEIFCLEPHERYADITSAMLQKEKVWWKCLVGGAKKWKEGSLTYRITRSDAADVVLQATKIEQRADAYIIELDWDDASLSFAEILHLAGNIPLPPYLNRAVEAADKERYQTIYAAHDGSVAAPTAGLHFTDAILRSLASKKIQHGFVTLHVGAGTFKPVKSDTMQEHEMHAEFIDVHIAFIERLLQNIHHAVIPVGTTSLRTLESLYWLGVKTKLDPSITPEALTVSQWEPYDLPADHISAADALGALLQWMHRHKAERLVTKTQIIIAPGYRFRIIRALVTNFHQPQSTLLLLVSAIVGEEWKNIYAYAMQNGFRFLSYGDGSLLWNEEPANTGF